MYINSTDIQTIYPSAKLSHRHLRPYIVEKQVEILAYHLVRRGSHRGGSPQNVLGDERTCGMTLASAYVLRRLSAAWLQLQMKEGSLSESEC